MGGAARGALSPHLGWMKRRYEELVTLLAQADADSAGWRKAWQTVSLVDIWGEVTQGYGTKHYPPLTDEQLASARPVTEEDGSEEMQSARHVRIALVWDNQVCLLTRDGVK